VRASVLATNSVLLGSASADPVFSTMNRMILPNLTLANADATGRVSVLVSFSAGGLGPQKTGAAEQDIELQLVVTPQATGIPIVIASDFEAYLANPASGFFDLRSVHLQRLLTGPPETNPQAIGGLAPGVYTFSVNWSVTGSVPGGPPPLVYQAAVSVVRSTRELSVIEQ